MKNKIDLSIVVPVYNEEKIIQPFLSRLFAALKNIKNFEIIFCADPCTDETEKVLKSISNKYKNVKALFFSRHYGQPTAVMAGILNCTGNACVVIDVDLQDPPEIIPILYKRYLKGFDVVYAKRKKRKGETLLKLLISHLGYKLINKISNVKIPKNTGDFRIISRRVIEELRKLPESHGFLRGLVAIIGFKQDAVEYDRDERYLGEGKYNKFFGSLQIGLNGVIGFSSFLLTLNLFLGMFVALISFLIAIWVVVHKLFFDTAYPLGVPTLIVIITFLGGVQLVAIGILGEYIGRIYDEVKNRPRFIIDKTFNIKNLIDEGRRRN